MNNMKNIKNVRSFLPIFLILLSSVIAIPLLNTEAVVTKPNPWVLNVIAVMDGYQPSLSPMSIQVVYNDTVPTVSMVGDSFHEVDIKPTDFSTDGITRTFSSSIVSDVSYQSAKGLYQTLKSIDESSFSQHTRDQDTTVYTLSTTDPFNVTITDELSSIDPDWTYLNFTCAEMYYIVTFDRVEVDKFFAEVKAKDGYALVADEESTNSQMITTLLDSVFGNHIFDIIHAPVNTTLLPTGITIAEEIEAVLSVNATDTSINGTTKIVSTRDAFTGYIGQRLAPDAVIKLNTFEPSNDGRFIGFEATAVTYTVYFDVKQDFTTGNVLDGNMGAGFSIWQPVDITEVTTIVFAVGIGLLIAAGVGAGCALIAVAIARKNKNVHWIALITFLVSGSITFIIYIVLRMSVTIT